MSIPTNFDIPESLETVWNALHSYREDCIPESDPLYDEEWDDICTAMAWITEALNRGNRNNAKLNAIRNTIDS